MFLINEILVFGAGRRQEALDRLGWIHGLMAKQPGFEKALVAAYLGDGNSHTILRLWQDEAAYLAFRQTPDGNYGRGRPEGLYVNERVVPQWNSFASGGAAQSVPFLVKTQWQVPEASWPAFEAGQKRLSELAQAAGAITVDFRAKEGTDALALMRLGSREDYVKLIDSDAYVSALREMPEDAEHVSTHCYEVKSEVAPTA